MTDDLGLKLNKSYYYNDLIDNGEDWIEMMLSRNTLSHLYDEEESLDILNLAIELDRGEYTYVEKNGKFVRLNNNTSLNPVGNSTDDDTDGR